ncbi:MAG: sensor histidine kinase, partial [Actinomycetota bacterium]
EKKLDCSAGCPLVGVSQSVLGVEVWRPLPDGRRQPLLASGSLVGEEGREVVHSFRDVTKLKEADEAKTLFLATASHELKTPLTVIQGFSDILLEENSQQEATDALQAISSRARGLDKIVDRILLSSRIESGRTTLAVAEIDLRALLVERALSFARAAGREVHLEVPASLPAVRGDADAVATVIDHLLDNAFKYSPAGGAVIVGATVEDRSVVASVSDPGIGMDEEQIERCFEKFWQAESSDHRRFGGTGIGLFIVRSLIEAMGGAVVAESRKGRGTTFRFLLRRAAAAPLPPGIGDRSQIREFMRQIGIPAKETP